MEKHTCKLCARRFSSGRALGGHMRSHVTADSLLDSSVSSSSGEAEEDYTGKGSSYVLRENPRKSFRIVDPEFSSFRDAAASSVVLQDGESETDLPRDPAAAAVCHGRRSKRPRNPPPEAAEKVSSVSGATAEEDVAVSLMMLSRDVGKRSADDEIDSLKNVGGSPQQQFRCEECRKVFGSYQALGGHRASHKKMKESSAVARRGEIPATSDGGGGIARRKTHECPVCFRVFGSGQALGGHKRSHLCSATAASAAAVTSPATAAAGSSKWGESWIDLNLPAPVEDEAAEVSAVSDAEFVVSNRIA